MFDKKTIMTTKIASVSRQTPIKRVIELLQEKNITGMPVVNDDMTLAGMISERDVLRYILDMKNTPTTAEDYMTKDVVSFDQDDEYFIICDWFIGNNTRRVPILSDGKIVGIISRKDVIKHLSRPLEYI